MLEGQTVLDLRTRARLGLNFLNRNVDRARGCLPYFWTRFGEDPAEARHDWPDFSDLTARYVEAFIMARRMTGDPEPGEVELALRRLLLGYFDENDGLSYRPRPARPYYSTILHADYDAHVAEGFDQSRVLWALLAWHAETGAPEIRERLDSLVTGLDRLMVKRADYGYYDRAAFAPGASVAPDAPPAPHQLYFSGPQIHPLVECRRRLGMERAGELAGRLTAFLFREAGYFHADGRWRVGGSGGFGTAETDGHSHARLAAIAGAAHWAELSADGDLAQHVRRCYDWYVDGYCAPFGWSPEFLGRGHIADEACETCVIMDQIHCALAFAGQGDISQFEKIERIARNQLFENQVTDTLPMRCARQRSETDQSSFRDIAERVRGGFAGWAGVNDFIGPSPHSRNLMNCCGPSGTHAMHDVWRNQTGRTEDTLRVRMFLDQENERLSLRNGQPFAGELTISMRDNAELQLLRRSWWSLDRTQVAVNSSPRDLSVCGPYLSLGRVHAGDRILVSYPLNTVVESVHVNGRDFTVSWRGDTVVDIRPPGRILPLYHRRLRSGSCTGV